MTQDRKILCVDTEPHWREQCADWGFDCSEELVPGYDLYIISSRLLDDFDTLPARFVVATAQQSTKEAARCYNIGALDYFVKDWQDSTRTKILEYKLLATLPSGEAGKSR